MQAMLQDALFSRPVNAQAAAQATIQGAVVDLGQSPGFDSVCFILQLNAVSNGGVTQLQAMENASNSNSGGVQVPGASAAHTDAGAGADSNGLLIVDVVRPKQRYVYPQITTSVANVAIDSCLAIRYRARSVPETQPAAVVASALSTAEL